MSGTEARSECVFGSVGVFGGTFDPVHLGHLRAAEEVRAALRLERVVFVPSANPPHKERSVGPTVAAAEDRLRWLRLAVAEHPAFEVDPIEIERGGTSFAVDTLRSLRSRSDGRPPTFLIGRDAFVLIATWREPEALFELANFAVMTRPPDSEQTLRDWIPGAFRKTFDLSADGQSARHRNANTSIKRVAIPALEISSSAIREGIAKGRSVRYLMPDPVYCAVSKSGHYELPSREKPDHEGTQRSEHA